MEQTPIQHSASENVTFAAQVALYGALTPLHALRNRLSDRLPGRRGSALVLAGGMLAISGAAATHTPHEAPEFVTASTIDQPPRQEHPISRITLPVSSEIELPQPKPEPVAHQKSKSAESGKETTLPKAIPKYYGSKELQEFGKEYVPDNIDLAYSIVRRRFPEFYTEAQMQALVTLWARESRWDHRAVNADSGAFGIAQSNPQSGAKMPKRNSPKSQIGWGLSYIQGRYGDPLTALKHSDERGWY